MAEDLRPGYDQPGVFLAQDQQGIPRLDAEKISGFFGDHDLPRSPTFAVPITRRLFALPNMCLPAAIGGLLSYFSYFSLPAQTYRHTTSRRNS